MLKPDDCVKICVFERSDAAEPIRTAVQQLNYCAVRGPMGPEATDAFYQDRNLVAAIVSDEVADPFAVSASIPPHIPRILVASDSSFSLRAAAARADFTAVIQRPMPQIELGDWLKAFVVERSVLAVSILVVDDDPFLADLHAEVLRSAGMNVTVVTQSMSALAAIETTRPDLILMDVQMPGVDGIALAKIIRQSRQHLAVPIVFLSAEQDVERQLEARRFGGDIFIKKPVAPKHLISLVRLRADRSKALRSMIERDSLTGLYNHGQFQERLIQEFDRCKRTKSAPSLAMIDIDHFKTVNDRFGHPAGDRVIRGLSSLLTSRLRKTDIIGRYGGEEFGVLLLDTPPEAAAKVIDDIRQIVHEVPFSIGNQSLAVTFSAGIAGAQNSETPAQLVAAADRCLYAAKHAGRNIVKCETE